MRYSVVDKGGIYEVVKQVLVTSSNGVQSLQWDFDNPMATFSSAKEAQDYINDLVSEEQNR